MNLDQTARVEQVLAASQADSIAAEARGRIEVTLEGVVGDKHYGFTRPADARTPWYPRGTPMRNSRQLTIVSVEELAEVAGVLGIPSLRPEWLGANLLISGLPHLTQLAVGTRLFFPGQAVLVVEGENAPCRVAGKEVNRHFPERADLAGAFPKAAVHRRGIAAWVERAGWIAAGDVFQIGR